MCVGPELDVQAAEQSSSDKQRQQARCLAGPRPRPWPAVSSADTQALWRVQAALATAAYEAVCKLYDRIEAAIEDPYKGAGDGFEQRWLV